MAIAYKILSEIFSLCLKLFDSVFGWLAGWLDVWLVDTTLFNSVLFCFVQFYSVRPSNFNQFIKIVIILIIFLYKWMDVCLLCDKLCFRLEFYQQVVDGRTTDDIFAIAIAIAIVIVIQWNSLLRFTGDSGRKRIAKEVTDVRDKSFSLHTPITTIFNNVTIWLWIEISMSNANDIHMHTKFGAKSKWWKFSFLLKFH